MKPNLIKTVSALGLGLAFQATLAGNITDIQVSVMPDQQRVIKVKFDRDVVEPSGFITSTPARIALDFPNTDIQMSQSNLSFGDNLLNQVVAAQGNGRARVLLGLTKEGQYNTEVKGNEVWVYVSEAKSGTSGNSGYNSKPTASAHGAPFNLDFRKGAQGSGLVEFVSDVEPDTHGRGDRIVITLKNYPLATQDQKNLDVTDFSTPVRTILAKRIGNDTVITIHNQGGWDYKVTKKNNRYVVQVLKSNKVAGSGLVKKNQTFTGKRISLDFQDVEVRTILQILAKESGMNIVASDTVQGKMTLVLKDVPWDQALDIVMAARDLDSRKNGNVINIAPRAELAKQDTDTLKTQKELDDLAPLLTRNFQLKYKNVEEFRNVLRLPDGGNSSANTNSILSSRGSVMIDPSTNTLIVTDNQKVIRKFEELIAELDVPAQQVMVEARIVEAGDGVSRDLGVKFGMARAGNTAWGNNMSAAINNSNVGRGTGSTERLINPNINLPLSTAVDGSIALIRQMSSGVLGLELSAMESDNRAKTISTPRVLTQDRKAAEIKQGFQIPYQTITDNGISTAFKDAVLSLRVTPRITPDSKIILDIAINKDDADYSKVNVGGEPAINTKQVTTQAMVENGGTLVVGGIYQETIQNNLRKVPLLGDLPVLGNLFKSRSRANSRNELLFFITPRIMGNESSVMRY